MGPSRTLPRRAIHLTRKEHVLVAVLAFGTFAGLFTVASLRAHTIDGSYDLGYFRQAAWLITHGEEPFITIRGLHLLGDHANLAFYPIAAVTAVLPDIPALLGIQAAALAVGVVPLWLICRRVVGLSFVPTAAFGVAYALYPALHNVNLADFHPEALAVPALLGAVLFALTDRPVPYWLCVALALSCREDMAVIVLFLGVFLLVERRTRLGLLTAGVAAAWLVITTQVLMPHFAGGFVQASFLEQYGDGIGEIVRTMVGDPFRVLGDLFTGQNGEFLIAVLAPLLFLPLLSPKHLIPIVPLEVLYLLSTRPAAHTIDAQYTVGAIAILFVAAAFGFRRLQEWRGARVAVPAAGLLVVAGLVAHTQLANDSVRERPWAWRVRDDVDRARLDAVDEVPDDADVAGSPRMWPLIADRDDLYNFPAPWEGYEDEVREDPVDLAVRQREVDFIVVDTFDGAQWTPDRVEALERLVPFLGARLVFDRAGIKVYAVGG